MKEDEIKKNLNQLSDILFRNTDITSLELPVEMSIFLSPKVGEILEKNKFLLQIQSGIFFENLRKDVIHQTSEKFKKYCYLTEEKIKDIVTPFLSEHKLNIDQATYFKDIYTQLAGLTIQKKME